MSALALRQEGEEAAVAPGEPANRVHRVAVDKAVVQAAGVGCAAVGGVLLEQSNVLLW